MAREQVRRAAKDAALGFSIGIGLTILFSILLAFDPDHLGIKPPLPTIPMLTGYALLLGVALAVCWGGISALFESSRGDRINEACNAAYQWFWRSAGIRWLMISLCAWIGVAISAPLWIWLFGVGPRPAFLNPIVTSSSRGQPLPVAVLWAIAFIILAAPYLAACVRVSEDIDIHKGIIWPPQGKAWWMAAGRVVRRAIGLVPITIIGLIIGLETLRWGALGLVKVAPPTGALFDALADTWAAVALVTGFGALGVVCGWWFCVKFLTRGARGGAGTRPFGAAMVDAGNRFGSFLMGAAYIAAGAGLGLITLWYGDYSKAPNLNDMLFGFDYWFGIFQTAIRWACYAGAGVLVFRGLSQWYAAFGWSGLSGDTHGRARWATPRELKDAGLSPHADGIYLGDIADGRRRATVGYRGPVHLMTIGPNGSGKGMGLIIPNVVSLKRSILIIDPKGQAAAITARARAKLGPVKIINPFNVLVDTHPHLKSTGFNPLAALDPNDGRFTDDCVGIARALVTEEFGSNAKFFSGSAQDLVTALIMHEKIEQGANASLGNVRKMLAPGLAVDDKGEAAGLARAIIDMTRSKNETLRAKSARFASNAKSNLEVIQEAINETRIFDSPLLQDDLAGEAIDWNLMKRELTTVYLILPADFLESHGAYLRLVVTSALRSLLRTPASKKLPPVLFMLDEFAQLGYMPPIENAMGIARDFGVQLWVILQDLNQLHTLYKDRWQTFVGARGALTAFAPRDLFTARYLADLCGTQTVVVESESERHDGKMGRSRGPQPLPLVRPEDLMAMPSGTMLCFSDPVKNPFLAHAPGYWETPFAAGLDPNPYYQPYRG